MSGGVLIDANVFIDLADQEAATHAWARREVGAAVARDLACINPLIYTELAAGFPDAAALEEALPPGEVKREPLPYHAAFPASRAYQKYRSRGGTKTSCLVDFFLGAHAEVAGHMLLTRDARRFRTYFPSVRLITPPGA